MNSTSSSSRSGAALGKDSDKMATARCDTYNADALVFFPLHGYDGLLETMQQLKNSFLKAKKNGNC
jgi:hypothetical protein